MSGTDDAGSSWAACSLKTSKLAANDRAAVSVSPWHLPDPLGGQLTRYRQAPEPTGGQPPVGSASPSPLQGRRADVLGTASASWVPGTAFPDRTKAGYAWTLALGVGPGAGVGRGDAAPRTAQPIAAGTTRPGRPRRTGPPKCTGAGCDVVSRAPGHTANAGILPW